MLAFTTLNGLAAPLPRANVDTDVIIRIERLTTIPRESLGNYAFEAIRFLGDGSINPEFLPAQSQFAGAPILITGPNFGCGSSRESAVWALQSMGYRCVIAPSFGSIFYGNCVQNGVLPLTLGEPEINELFELATQGKQFAIDLQRQTIIVDERVCHFEIDPLRKGMLLQGLDEIGSTLLDAALIRSWQDNDRLQRPWVWNATGIRIAQEKA